MNIWIKAILCFFIVIGLVFGGFILMLISLLLGGQKFYTPLIVATTIIIIVYIILLLYQLVKPALLHKIVLSLTGLALILIGVHEISQAYRGSVAIMSDQDTNLYDYRPFGENSKVKELNEPSTLKLTDDLPKLDGATALYPLYSAFAQATYPERNYDIYNSEVQSNQTDGAYKNLFNGLVDVIFVARPSEQQLAIAKQRGIELKLTPIGREAFVFFVNAKNKVDGLSTEQLQDIYSGKVTNWKEVGGNNDEIRAFQRPQDSGSQTMLQKFMDGKPLMTPPKEDVVAGMGGIIEETSTYRNYKNALGFSFRYFATEMTQNGDIKLLNIDGIPPDKENIRNEKYPLTAEFYAVTAGSDNPNVQRLVDWILSSQGQYLVEKTGYVKIVE